MSITKEDLGEIGKEINSWAKRIPAEAQAFHNRRIQLQQQMEALRGAFQRDPAQAAQIHLQFQELKADLPALELLQTKLVRARAAIAELRAGVSANETVKRTREEWANDSLALLDHVCRVVGDRKSAAPVIAQVNQMEQWALERRQAADLIYEATQLIEQPGLRGKEVLEFAIRDWTERFRESQSRIDVRFDVQRERSRFAALRREFEAEQAKTPATPPPAATVEAVAEDQEAAPALPFHFIAQALAECRDLAEALVCNPPEITEFESRQWQLRNKPGDPASIQRLREDIDAFHQELLEQAKKESEQRFEILRSRWNRFREIYDERDPRSEVAELVASAEAAKSDAANGLSQFFEKVELALQRIYHRAYADRPRLAAWLRKAADRCRAQAAELRQQAKLIAVDTALAQLELRIPADAGVHVNAQECFERLEECDEIERELLKLKAQNAQSQSEIVSKAVSLNKLAALITKVGTPQEMAAAAEVAGKLPHDFPAAVSLDETSAVLTQAESRLEALLAQVRERSAADLVELRRENLAWIRLLAEFAPEAEALVTSEPPPREMEQLQAAIVVETRHRQRIGDLLSKAAKQLAERGEQVCDHLREHLRTPAFETHPERETAELLFREVEALPTLSEAPGRNTFAEVYNCIAEAEAFIDRLESAKREIPGKVKTLTDRFARLRELNALIYRRALAERANLMLLGMQKAIAQQQWEPLVYQISETENLIAALEADARIRISADTEALVERLRNAMKNSTDTAFVRQADSILKQVEEAGHFDPPGFQLRRRLSRLAANGPAPNPEARRSI